MKEQKIAENPLWMRALLFCRHQEALQRVEALQLSVRQAQENYRIIQNRYLNQLAILTDLLGSPTRPFECRVAAGHGPHSCDLYLLSTSEGLWSSIIY